MIKRHLKLILAKPHQILKRTLRNPVWMKTSNRCGWVLERWEKALGRESSAHLQVPGLLLVSMASQTTDKAFGSSCKSSPELPRLGLYASPELPTLVPPARLSVITCTMWGSVCESSCQA